MIISKITNIILSIALLSVFSVAGEKENKGVNLSFEKWGAEYSVGAPILKSIAMLFTDMNSSYSEEIGMGYKAVGIMGIEDSILETPEFTFLKGVDSSALSKDSLNIRVAAALLSKCVLRHKRTPMAVRCYSEYIAEEEAVKMSKLFPTPDRPSISES